jgi:drug/metabolite transporter (DMT)-like permease
MCNKILIAEIPPFLAAAIRFLLASVAIIILYFIFTRDHKLSRLKIKNAITAGTLFLTLGNGGVMWALQYVDSGYTALLISTQPLVLLILMYIHYKQRIGLLSWIGVLLGIIGIFLLVNQNEIVTSSDQWLGIAVIFGCLLAWGYGSLFVRNAELPENYFLNAGIQMFVGGISLLIISFLSREGGFKMNALSNAAIWSLVYLVIFGSIVAFTAFNFLLKHVSPEKVATNTYVNPIVAMFLGWYILNEIISLQSIIAAAVLLLGVYFINTSKA